MVVIIKNMTRQFNLGETCATSELTHDIVIDAYDFLAIKK